MPLAFKETNLKFAIYDRFVVYQISPLKYRVKICFSSKQDFNLHIRNKTHSQNYVIKQKVCYLPDVLSDFSQSY